MMISPASTYTLEYRTYDSWKMPSRAATLNGTFYLAQIENAFTTIDTWLEDFVSEFRHDIRDEIRIGVGEEGYGRHQRSAVVVYHILK